MSEIEIEQTIVALVSSRGEFKTICPSEVARQVDARNWRKLMPAVRAVATQMADQGQIVATQGGQPVNPAMARGPIRLGLPKLS